jgi:hypothetical protein
MPVDLTPYFVAAGEKPASSSKQNNTLTAIQGALNSIPPAQIQGYPSNAGKYLDGSGNWSTPGVPTSPWIQMGYVTNNVDVPITATTAATATQLIALPAIACDGGIYWLEYYCGRVYNEPLGREMVFRLYLDNTGVQDCGSAGVINSGGINGTAYSSVHIRLPWTPAAGSRVFSMRCYFTGGSGTCHADGTRFQYLRMTRER